MNLVDGLVNREWSIAIIGLGYVGLPLAVAFAERGLRVIGFDIDGKKIDLCRAGIDPTDEVGDAAVKAASVRFTGDERDLRDAAAYIVTVPTPVNSDHSPDLTPVISASEIVGRNMRCGSLVVFESTVYPGCTEDVCIPILERESGLRLGDDFKVGYSPERINPGDRQHRLKDICKIVSGNDKAALEQVRDLYGLIIEAGTFPVSNLRTAEAVKVVENSQRDINIAFMNELAMVFDRMGIDTNEVVDGMNTKWNALGFRPGLVGGHCIGVDPYYFTYKAERLGLHSRIVLNGRIMNESMGRYIADTAVKKMVVAGLNPRESTVAILGFTFKENCRDARGSKVYDVLAQLRDYGISPQVIDPWADEQDGVELCPLERVKDADCIIVAVAHEEFRALSVPDLEGLYRDVDPSRKVLIDVKGLYPVEQLEASGMQWWRL